MTYLDGLKLVSEALDDGVHEVSSQQCTSDSDTDVYNPFTNLRYVLRLACMQGLPQNSFNYHFCFVLYNIVA